MAYPEVLPLLNDEIYLLRISVQNSLVKVAIYEIYYMKWVDQVPQIYGWRGGGEHGHLGTRRDAYVYYLIF